MKTQKQKNDEIKKQTQVNGKPEFDKNGKLVLPQKDKSTPKKAPKKEPKPIVKPEVTVLSFLSFLKKHLDNVEEKPSTQGYTKISVNSKVLYYLKQGVRKPEQVLGWNQREGKQMHIAAKKDMDKLLVEIKKVK